VLASGDPFHYGVGAVLARHIDAREMIVVPALSAFNLAAARLGWSLPQTVLLSLHGRMLDLVRPHLQPGARILALTSDGDEPAALAKLLAETGFGGSRLTVLEALGGPRERIRGTTAAGFEFGTTDALNVVAIEVTAAPAARVLTLAPGLADNLFEHDGQITKREIRAVTLSSLAARRGELLWDIGAGSGSVAIEWMLADPAMRAIAVEQRADRAARIRRNAAACGVPGLDIIEGAAPAALTGLATPDAVFIGGGASDVGTLDAAARALRPGGRLVVNAVTLETEALLIARHAALGGELIRIALSRAAPVGEKTGWRAAMPVTQWLWTKP
jgi:precorrin-6Y C5,15-methyltransferase (decarboxylating)